VIIQIYAFTRIDQAVAAFDVDHIGFMKWCSWRLSSEARRLAQALPLQSVRVALTMATSVGEILRMAEAVEPDIVHISTDLEEVGEGAMELLRLRLPTKIRLMKAIQVEARRASWTPSGLRGE
jgi:phosphoribosylanthranilate isomerase